MKYAWIEENRDQFPVARMCRLLSVSRSGYLQWRGRPPSGRALANAVLDAQVAVVHADSRRTYGRPRIQRALRSQGVHAGHERIRRSLRRQGLHVVYRRPYRITTDSQHSHPVAPNRLERRFNGWKPDQAWVADITYVPTAEGWLYLACVLDLGTRRIVGWSMSEQLKAALACDAQMREPGGANKAIIPPKVRASVLARDRHRCATPGCGATRFLAVQHVVARSLGGSNR